MSSHYVAHTELTNEQRSGFSTLSGALIPATRSQYKLPQEEYYPIGQVLPPRSMKPILFEELHGSPWMSLVALRKNINDLARTMVGGSDLVFAQRPSPIQFEFQIIWPGYLTRLHAQVLFYSGDTTRAVLGQIIGNQVEIFMKHVSVFPSTNNPYTMGSDGIRSGQVLLGGIKNTYGDTTYGDT